MPARATNDEMPEQLGRIVVMGTGPFAVPMFEAILNSPQRVLALVTRPDRPSHRRDKSPVNPMREAARGRGIDVFEPESINSAEAQQWLRERKADLFVVCDYGQILSRETLSLARLGGINLHASLLPKYRGAAPINWAIFHGEQESGVTVIHMTPKLDAGPALVQRSTPIGANETAPELELRLAALGSGAVLEAIDVLATGREGCGIEQDPKLATKAPRLKKEDGLVDWTRSAVCLFNQVKALQPWPKTYTFWQATEAERVQLILNRVHVYDGPSESAQAGAMPGTVVIAKGNELVVVCGKGTLQIEAIQPAGKRTMSAGEFLRGHALKPGTRLG
jgi:methionyl-tRNA formyltransferase